MKTKYTGLFILLLFFCSFPAAYAQKTIQILHTSDTHSRIEPIDINSKDKYAGLGGYLRRVELVDQMRKTDPDLLLFDCGDFSQGTPYYNMYEGEVEVKLMNLMKYDAVLIGNHEFDFGMENLERLCKMATFPIISSNYNVENSLLKGLVKPYIILERDDIKIGVIGVCAPLEGLVQASRYEGVVYEDPVKVANKLAAELKLQQKCDVVICLSHLGVRSDETFISDSKNIDVVLGGHSHTFMEEPQYFLNADKEAVALFHTGKNGVFVGNVTLTFE